MITLLLDLLITVVIYTVPMVVYRYAIRKKPMEKAKARNLTIIYALIAFVIMNVICISLTDTAATGGGVLLWSFVNYNMLTKESNKNKDKTE